MNRRRFDILDAWRSLAVVLMLVYHFLFDLYIFGVMTGEQLFCAPLNLLQKFICCSFILLAGMSARFSRSNLRHGLTVLLAGVAVEFGAAVGGQTIRCGILMFLGMSMLLYHAAGKWLQKIPGPLLAAGCGVLFPLTDWWTGRTLVSVRWLYPLGFFSPGFYSADYFPPAPPRYLAGAAQPAGLCAPSAHLIRRKLFDLGVKPCSTAPCAILKMTGGST